MAFGVIGIALIFALVASPASAKTEFDRAAKSRLASFAPLDFPKESKAERETKNEALDLFKEAQLPGENQIYRDIFFQLFRLQKLEAFRQQQKPGAKSLDLDSLGPPLASWPIKLPDLVKLLKDEKELKKQLGKDKRPKTTQLGELLALLRVENKLQREEGYQQLQDLRASIKAVMGMNDDLAKKLGIDKKKKLRELSAKLTKTQDDLAERRKTLLRDFAKADLDAMTRLNDEFENYRMHLPRPLRASLENAAKAAGFKLDIDDKKGGIRVGNLQKLLADDKVVKSIPANDMLALSASARALSRGVRGDLAQQDDLASLFEDLKHKRQEEGDREVPQRNAFQPPITVPGQLPGGLKEFYAPSTETPRGSDGGANACYTGGNGANLLPPEDETKQETADLVAAQAAQTAGPTSFRIQTHTAANDLAGKVSSCMGSISDQHHPSPDDREKERFVLFTAGHCASPLTNGLDILGVANIKAADMGVIDMAAEYQKMLGVPPGQTDAAAIYFDLPRDLADRLIVTQKNRFVSLPPENFGKKDIVNRFVTSDINFVRPVSDREKLIGKTFEIPGDTSGNFIGINHLLPENEGQGIDPGTSGTGNVLNVVENGKNKKYYLGPTSYKCLAGVFRGAVGGIVSGKKVFAFYNSVLKGPHSAFQPNRKKPSPFDLERLIAHAKSLHLTH